MTTTNPNKTKETAKMLLEFYNLEAKTIFHTNLERNQQEVIKALEKSNNDVAGVRDHIRNWIKANPEACKKAATAIKSCFAEYQPAQTRLPIPEEKEVEPAPQPVVAPTPAPQPVQVSAQEIGNAMGLLEQAVVQLISKTQADKIEANIMGTVEETIRNFIKEEYGTIERKVTTVVDGKKVQMQGICHEKFEKILQCVANKKAVYLVGPAGTGKNVLCKQVADALGLKFYFTNAVTQEYKLTGFTDAMGNYQETQFYKAFVNGGLFMLDEMDASIPEALNILNAALANGYFDFPAPIGYKEAHKDFRVIAAGNTLGKGADMEYVGRNQLDAATLDRFLYERIDYSEAIENSVAHGDLELANFCREYRESARRNGLQVIVSYRAIGNLADMKEIWTLEEALESCLVKGLEVDSINMILTNLSESKYKTALRNLAKSRKD